MIKGLIRGATRGPLTAKQGNKKYYKGNRSGRMGSFTRKGTFIIEEWKKREWMVPDLEGFELTPYINDRQIGQDNCLSSNPDNLRGYSSTAQYFEGVLPNEMHLHQEFMARIQKCLKKEIEEPTQKLYPHKKPIPNH